MVGDQAIINMGPSEDDPCAHHWLIESPDGETSRGTCRLCGASREFLNYNQRPTLRAAARPLGDASGRGPSSWARLTAGGGYVYR